MVTWCFAEGAILVPLHLPGEIPKDAAILASRTLALLLTVWALTELSYLPDSVYAFVHHMNRESVLSTAPRYWHHYYLVSLGFLVVRIAGISLAARWLFKGGPNIEKLFLPVAPEGAAQN
jgi:hypothetical protein